MVCSLYSWFVLHHSEYKNFLEHRTIRIRNLQIACNKFSVKACRNARNSVLTKVEIVEQNAATTNQTDKQTKILERHFISLDRPTNIPR